MKKRKLQAAFLSLILSAGVLAACTGEQSSSNEGNSGDGDSIKIGANLELTGSVASYGTGILKGLELAIEEINKDGIDGKNLELIKDDNKSEEAEATNGALKLMNQDKVSTIVGEATRTNTFAQVQLAREQSSSYYFTFRNEP